MRERMKMESIEHHQASGEEDKSGSEMQKAASIYLTEVRTLQTLFDSLRPIVVCLDREGKVEYANTSLVRILGASSREEVEGRSWFVDFVPQPKHNEVLSVFSDLLEGNAIPSHHANPILTLSGEERLIVWNNVLRRNQDEHIVGTLSIGEDMTEQKRAEETILEQARDIMALANPVLQIWDGILLAPLIGTFEEDRAQKLTERLLEAIVMSASRIVILDVTGVPMVDTQSAQSMTDAITAARLLGADVILTGMRPALAQTMVELGITLAGIETRGSLQAGLRAAMVALER